jgi:uncharacterized repeat protein (TIGR01451 family)
MNHPRKFLMTILAATLLLPVAAWAKPQVELAISAEKELTVTEDGQEVLKRVPAGEAAPGETVIYTIHYENVGDEPATNVVVSDPIPEGTAYVPGSATEKGELTFSIDGGKSYKRPFLLTYEVTHTDGTKEELLATPELYTHIRWTLPNIVPEEKGAVSFKVKVK